LESLQAFPFPKSYRTSRLEAKIFELYSAKRFWINLNYTSSIMPKHEMESDEQVTPTPFATDSIAQLDLNLPRSSKTSYESPYLQIKSEAAAIVGDRPFGLAPQSQQVGAVLGLDSKPLKSSPSSSPASDASSPGNSVTPDVAKRIKSSRKFKVRDPRRHNLV
jgi:hypothetical protein